MTTPVDNALMEQISPNGQAASGTIVERLLANNFNVNALRPQNVLRRDEWKHFDNVITEIARERLVGIGDLMSRGLSYNLPNAMGKTIIEWEKVGDMAAAQVSMDGVTDGQNDRMLFSNDSMPIPLYHKDFRINARALAASRTLGESLDMTQARYATRKVVELAESVLFKGSTVMGANKALYGYTTQPQRNTGSVTASWLTATGDQIVTDVLNMIGAAVADNMYGPYMMYVPVNVHVALNKDLKANSDKSIMSRLKEIPGILDIRPTSQLTASNIVLVQMTQDVVEIIDGIQPTMIQWDTNGGMTMNFKVIAIMPPRFRNDYNNQSGIVHYS